MTGTGINDGFSLAEEAPETSARALPARSRLPFRLKLTALAAVLSVAPLVAIGYLLIDVNERTVKTSSRAIQLAAIEDVTRTIEAELASVENALDAIGRALAASEMQLATRLVESEPDIDHVAIFDSHGSVVDVIAEAGADRPALPEPLSAELLKQARIHGVATGAPLVHGDAVRVLLVIPVRGAAATWFAASYASLTAVQERVEALAETRFEGVEEAIFIVDDSLRVIAHANREEALALSSGQGHGILANIDGAALGKGLALAGEFDGDDGKMVGSLRSLDSRPWAVVAQVPSAQAYSSLARMRRIIIIAIVAAMLLSLFAAVLVARHITAPIAALVKFASDLAARKFNSRVTVHTHDELSLLGVAMSNAAAELEASEARIHEEIAIRSDLGRYLPGQLVDKVVLREQNMALGGERRDITVLFADVVGFTPLAEKHSAEEVVTILNEVFTILSEVVFRHGGTLDKFIGDCVMAFWGAPTASADHATLALRAAEDMLRFLEVGNEKWQEEYGLTINIAIGVNTGEAVVGNFGSESRMEYTAIGDAVNIAARLEVIARPQQILITDSTMRAAGDEFECLSLGAHALAGRSGEVELFEVRL